MSDRIRVAVVGTGEWWGREHARVWSARPDSELVAIVGRTPDKTKARAAEFGTTPYTDLEAMLDRERPDLVSVCLPNEGHFEPTLRIIRAGFPLLVEKPLVFDRDEAEQLLAEAASRDLFFAINFNHRYARPVQMARAAIASGDLGEVVFATWRFGGEAGTSADPHANLIETQCHGFDMLEHLCGPISSVAAHMTDMTGRGFSTIAVSLGFSRGGVGSLTGSYDSSYAYPGTHHLEINGSDGRIVIEDTVASYTFSAQRGRDQEGVDRRVLQRPRPGLSRHVRALSRRDGPGVPVGGGTSGARPSGSPRPRARPGLHRGTRLRAHGPHGLTIPPPLVGTPIGRNARPDIGRNGPLA